MRFVRAPVEIELTWKGSRVESVSLRQLNLDYEWKEELENANGYIMNGKLIHFIAQRKRFGKGCEHRCWKQRNVMAVNLNRIPERSDNLSFAWETHRFNPILGALLNTCGRPALKPPASDQTTHAKRPVGHTFTCDVWRRRRQCQRRAEQKPRIKIHGIIKFTVRPTWIRSTRKKKWSPSAAGTWTIYTPANQNGGKKEMKEKKRNYPSSTWARVLRALWLWEL